MIRFSSIVLPLSDLLNNKKPKFVKVANKSNVDNERQTKNPDDEPCPICSKKNKKPYKSPKY